MNPVHVRWKNHKKFVRKGISFRPEYAVWLSKLAGEKGVSQRQIIEDALDKAYGGIPSDLFIV